MHGMQAGALLRHPVGWVVEQYEPQMPYCYACWDACSGCSRPLEHPWLKTSPSHTHPLDLLTIWLSVLL